MAGFRFAVPYFQVANSRYVGAAVTCWTVDGNGQKTGNRATLYSGVVGSGALPNPIGLDSEGKFPAKVYVEEPVILTVNIGAESFDTAIIAYSVRPRGAWVGPGTIYAIADVVAVPSEVTANAFDVAICAQRHTSTGDFPADLAAGKWIILIDASAIVAEATEAADTAADLAIDAAETATTKAEDAAAAAEAAEAAMAAVLAFTVSPVSFTFDGDGVSTVFTLPAAPTGPDNLTIFVGGLYSRPPAWSLAGATLTFASPPPVGPRMVAGVIGGQGIGLDAEAKFQHLAWEALRLGFEKLSRTDAVALYQPLDADLTAIAALATTSYGRALLTLADISALRAYAGLEVGLGPAQQAPNWATIKS